MEKKNSNSLANIDIAIQYFKKENAIFYIKRALIVKKAVLKEVNKYKELASTYETLDSLNNFINNTQINTYLQEAEIESNNSKKTQEILLLKNRQKTQHLILTIVISLFIVTCLLIYVLITKLKKNRIEKKQEKFNNYIKTQEKIANIEQREQNRIAKELHDIIGAQLIVLKLYLTEPKFYSEALLKIDSISDKLRLISHNLLKKDFSKQTLNSLIEDFTHSINNSSDVIIDLFIDDFYNNINDSTKIFIIKGTCRETSIV